MAIKNVFDQVAIKNLVGRMVTEEKGLDANIEKLHVFIQDSGTFKGLDIIDQRDLLDQRTFMVAYRDVLRRRIARVKEALAKYEEKPNRTDRKWTGD